MIDTTGKVLALVKRLDEAAGFDPTRSEPVEKQTAHLSDEQRTAWRELRRRVDLGQIGGEGADAAVDAMVAALTGNREQGTGNG